MTLLPFTTQDAVTVLKKSENLNAALKNFLKTEIRNGDPAGRFVKDFRDLIDATDSSRLEGFLDRSRTKFETHIIGVGGYAHAELVREIVANIADKYAEEFNSTYTISGDKVDVKNQKRFDEIAKEAFAIIEKELASRGFDGSVFLKNVVLVSIFDRGVLTKILERS